MKSKTFMIVAGVAGVLLVAGVAASQLMAKPEAPAYITETVKLGDVEPVVLTSGILQPFETVEVGSLVSGQLIKLNVHVGQKVKAGEVIAQIDAQRQQNQLRDRESQLNAQRQNVMQFTAQVENAQQNLVRQQRLKDTGYGSVASYEQAVGRRRNAGGDLANFEGQLKTAQIAVDGAREELERATIRAPTDGLVTEVLARQGQILNAFQSTPIILKIGKMDVMTVRAQVSEADIVKVRPGQPAYFTVVGDPNTKYRATLRTREITPAGGGLDPAAPKRNAADSAIFYNALFEVPNPNGLLLPAMTADVRVVLGEAKNVLTIPLTALGAGGPDGLFTVRVLEADGKLAERRIAIGLTDTSVAEVRSGLKAGERVVVAAAS